MSEQSNSLNFLDHVILEIHNAVERWDFHDVSLQRAIDAALADGHTCIDPEPFGSSNIREWTSLLVDDIDPPIMASGSWRYETIGVRSFLHNARSDGGHYRYLLSRNKEGGLVENATAPSLKGE